MFFARQPLFALKSLCHQKAKKEAPRSSHGDEFLKIFFDYIPKKNVIKSWKNLRLPPNQLEMLAILVYIMLFGVLNTVGAS